MAGLFSHQSKPDYNQDECTVLQVDANRSLCKVRTLSGKTLDSVQWLSPFGGSNRGGDRFSPHVGDRAVITYGLGYPLIIGYLAKMQVSNGAFPLQIHDGSSGLDTGNYSPGGESIVPDQNKPKDYLAGDRVLTSIGGAMVALLRAGTLVLKSSPFTSIVLSKVHSTVKVCARNWELFTEVGTELARNFKGRIYKYQGFSKDKVEAKNEVYRLHRYEGDVACAEAVKTLHNSFTGTPSTSAVLLKEQITQPNLDLPILYHRELDQLGHEELKAFAADHFTKQTQAAEQVQITYSDQHLITINEGEISLVRANGAIVRLNASGVFAQFNGGEVKIESGTITASKAGSTVTLDSGGVTATKGSSSMALTSSSAVLNSGGSSATLDATSAVLASSGHQISVNAAGIQVT